MTVRMTFSERCADELGESSLFPARAKVSGHMLWGVGRLSTAYSKPCSTTASSSLMSGRTMRARSFGDGRGGDQHQCWIGACPDRHRIAFLESMRLHRRGDAHLGASATWWVPLLMLFGF